MDPTKTSNVRRKLIEWHTLVYGSDPSPAWVDAAVDERIQNFGPNYSAIVNALQAETEVALQFDAEMRRLVRVWFRELIFPANHTASDEQVKYDLGVIKKHHTGDRQAIKDDLVLKILLEQILNAHRAGGLNTANEAKTDQQRLYYRNTFVEQAKAAKNLRIEDHLSASALIEYMKGALDVALKAMESARARAAEEEARRDKPEPDPLSELDNFDAEPPAGGAAAPPPAGASSPPPNPQRVQIATQMLNAVVDEVVSLLLQAEMESSNGSRKRPTKTQETRARRDFNQLLQNHVPMGTEKANARRLPYANLYKSVLQFYQLKHQLKAAMKVGAEDKPGYETEVITLLQSNNNEVEVALAKMIERSSEYRKDTECRSLVKQLMQAEARKEAGGASSNPAIDGGEEEREISDERLDARVKSETELAEKEGKGCIAQVKEKLLDLQRGGDAAQRQQIAAEAAHNHPPGAADAGLRNARKHMLRKLILENKPHGHGAVEEALESMRNALPSHQRKDSALVEAKALQWLRRVEQAAGRQPSKDAMNAALRDGKLLDAVVEELRVEDPKVQRGKQHPDVVSRAQQHLREAGYDVLRATNRAKYAAVYLEVLMLKNNQKRSKTAKRDLETQLRMVGRSGTSWHDATKKLNREITSARTAGSDPARPAPSPVALPQGTRYDSSSSSEDDEDAAGGGGGGASRVASNPNPDDDDDDDGERDLPEDDDNGYNPVANPFAEPSNDNSDQNLCASEADVDARQRCDQRKQHCADKHPKLSGYPQPDNAYVDAKKSRAVGAHMEEFMFKHTDRLPNNAWYVAGEDPLREPPHDGHDESLPSDNRSDGYTVNFLGGGAYELADKAAWKAFYENEVDLTHANPAKYFNLSESNEWSQKKLEALFEITKRAHEQTLNVERIFAWRLVVVHLRVLRIIGCTEKLPVTACFEMDALVDNVAHMLKYRRCVRMAKCLYTNVGMRSLHEQYRAGLLNVQHAHHHQDESATELGIARRIVRQAHVANYVHYYWYKQEALTSKVYADIASPKQRLLLAERFCTNPPMAPIMCSAPPRSGKSALAMLMISFAVKLGASVEYGVSPNKKIPVADVKKKFSDLGWSQKQGLPEPSTPAPKHDSNGQEEAEIRHIQMRRPKKMICIYSEDELRDVVQMNRRIHAVGSDVDAWTFHVRDEAQTLVKSSRLHQEPLPNALRDSYPCFYGLSMCVSATLLPVYEESEMTGSTDSIYQLLNKRWKEGDRVRVVTRRGALEKNVVLQHWSFPLAPDYLTPPRSAYPLSPVPQTSVPYSDQRWYKNYYEEPSPGVTIERTTHYYGTHFHIQKRAGPGLSLHAKITLDAEWYKETRQCDEGVREALDTGRLSEAYRLEHAYFEYLKKFNQVNKRYFHGQPLGKWQEGPTTRIANPPIKRLTHDTLRILGQAVEWLETGVEPAAGTGVVEYWPMYILAPVREQNLRNGRQEWAVMLCKLAWHRFYTAWEREGRATMRQQYSGEKGKKALRKDYGINVLVYASKRMEDDYIGLVCQAADFRLPVYGQQGLVCSIVFDPTLRENRLPQHTFDWDEEGGVMLQSILVPELATGASERNEFRAYAKAVAKAVAQRSKDLPKAAEWLRKHVVLTSHTFNHSLEYAVDVREAAPAQEAPGREVEELGEEQATEGAVRPRLEAQSSDSEEDAEVDDGANAKIANLNAIALRLCVSQHANAQDAISNGVDNCDICKVAAVGHAMFSAGLTLQTTLARTAKVKMFIPRHMSLWASTLNNGPDLSALYQLVGRGFADLKLHELPKDWKLDLLCQKGLLKYIEAYGDAELLASMVHNESLEGRRMTLGATLWTASKSDLRKRYGTRRLKSDEKNNTLLRMLFHGSLPSENLQHQRVFGKVRDCLVGENAPQKRSWLTQQERRLEFWDRAFVGEATDYGDAPVELQRHDLGAEVEALKTGKDEIGLLDDPCFALAAPPALANDGGSGDEDDGGGDDEYYDVPRDWSFSHDKAQSVQRSERLERAKMRTAENDHLVTQLVDGELQEQGVSPEQREERKRVLTAKYADMVEGADLRMRIRYRNYESVHVWRPEKLAEEIVSDQGRYEGLFDWYLSELRVQEDKQWIVSGKRGRVAPAFGVEKPPTENVVADAQMTQAYMRAVKQAHVSVLMRTDQWVQTFCKYAKHYLLDLKHGSETACDPQWIHYRQRFLGEARGYSEANEKRWKALRLRRFNNTVVEERDIALAKAYLENDAQFESVTRRCRADGKTTWDAFADAIEDAFEPDRAIKALVQTRVGVAPAQAPAPAGDGDGDGDDSGSGDDNSGRGGEGDSSYGEDAHSDGSDTTEGDEGNDVGPALDGGNTDTPEDDDDEPQEIDASEFQQRDVPEWVGKLSTETGDRRYQGVQVLMGGEQGRAKVLKGERELAKWAMPTEDNSEVATLMDHFAEEVAKMRLDPATERPRMQQPVGVPGPEEFPPQLLEKHRDAQFDQSVSWKAIWSLIRVDPLAGVMKEYITDEIVGLYINMMNARNQQMRAIEGYSGKLRNTYFFPSMFFSNIWDKNRTPAYDFSKQQPKNDESLSAKQRGDVFERDLAFVVVNISNQHWTLIVINFIKRRIEYFDGFDRGGKLLGTPAVYINVVRRWLMDEKIRLSNGEETWDTTGWSYHVWTREQGKPGQDDGYNCGIIALQVANYYAQRGKLAFGAWQQFRLRMLSEIINGELYDGDNWLELDTAPAATAAAAEAAAQAAEARAAIELAERYYQYVSSRAKDSPWAQVLNAARDARDANRYDKRLVEQLEQLTKEARVTYANVLDRYFAPVNDTRERKRKSLEFTYKKEQWARSRK